MKLTETCNVCNTDHTITLKSGQYDDWKSGTPIQVAMPTVSPDDRELLISGICGICFDNMFGGE